MSFDEEQGPVCEGCNMLIDPNTCQCGIPVDEHNDWSFNHIPVPMGCACHLTDR